ncbi:MAG TPA: 23S rRNA (guanosine(2251)-2'-O)-methyltransferase RlmB [Saprospiraceae bacterium]|nr:23S rRNA (guanosine(2251)-2'-O)-methyltransferase RlmB [Saprospiraceae bacterium]
MEMTIYGRNPVKTAIEEGKAFEKVFVLRELTGEFEVLVRQYCRDQNIPISKVPAVKLDHLTRNKNHQGVVAILSPIVYNNFEDIFSQDDTLGAIALILDGITDVRNVGAIARSALAFGVKGLILGTGGSVSIHEDAIKSSSGALLKIPVCREKNTLIAIEKLQQMGYYVWAADGNARQSIRQTKAEGPVAIIIGAEGKGVSKEALKIADTKVRIEHEKTMDSLNVSVATGIILYELYHQMTGE